MSPGSPTFLNHKAQGTYPAWRPRPRVLASGLPQNHIVKTLNVTWRREMELNSTVIAPDPARPLSDLPGRRQPGVASPLLSCSPGEFTTRLTFTRAYISQLKVRVNQHSLTHGNCPSSSRALGSQIAKRKFTRRPFLSASYLELLFFVFRVTDQNDYSYRGARVNYY